MSVFEDGLWQSKDRFFFWPGGICDLDVDRTSGQLCATENCGGRTTFRIGIEIQPKSEHRLRKQRYQFDWRGPRTCNLGQEELQKLGITCITCPTENQFCNSGFARWFEDESISFLDVGERRQNGKVKDLTWRRVYADGRIETKLIPLPVSMITNDRDVRMIHAEDGRHFITFRTYFDGRWTVFEWNGGHVRLVIDQRSPMLLMACVDGIWLLIVVTIIPMLVLAIAIRTVQSRQRFKQFGFANLSVSLATTVRRSLARLLDLSIILPPILLSVVLHPEVIEWWTGVLLCRMQLFEMYESLADFLTLDSVRFWVETFLLTIAPVPVLWPIFCAGIIVLLAQIILQGWTGYTIGKWLCGVRVLRTTLRPCGFARSLLREILLVVDSSFLLSWVPGALCMLATSNTQRLGDLMADTIVIRNQRRPATGD